MPAKRLSWFKLWIGSTAHGKVRQLDDGTFRTWVELLDAAAQQPKRGRFDSIKEAAAVTRRPGKHIVALVKAGLMDELDEGLLMHDWDDWQRWHPDDVNGSPTTTEPPPNGRRNGTRTTHEEHTNVEPPRAGARRRKTEETEEDVDEEKTYPPEAPLAAAKGAALAEPVLTTKRAKRVAGERTPISAEALDELVVEYGAEFPGGESAARLAADRAMNNQARLKALDERRYVQTWLRGDLERLKANGHAPPAQDVPRLQLPPTPPEPCPDCHRPIDARGSGHEQRPNLNRTLEQPDPLIPCRLFGKPPSAWQQLSERSA